MLSAPRRPDGFYMQVDDGVDLRVRPLSADVDAEVEVLVAGLLENARGCTSVLRGM